VYDVTTEVKVPEGLTAEDLARPVIQVRDFETGEPTHEIYTFNRQVVTVPLDEQTSADSGIHRIARKEVEREIRAIARDPVEVALQGRDTAVVYVSEDDISTVIGKGGGRIGDVENRLGIDIDVRTHDERPGSGTGGGPTGETVTPEVTGKHVVLRLDDHVGETVEVLADGEYLLTATVGRGGEVQVSRGSAIADELEQAVDRGEQVTVVPTDD
jgi:ATPase